MLAVGCGGGGNNVGIKEGDKLVVIQAFDAEADRISFEASYGEVVETKKGADFKIDHSDGALLPDGIPEGTELEVVVPPKTGSNIIVVKISKSDGVTGKEELEAKFLPERFRTPDFLYYRISLKTDYLGTKIKKVD
jgi:formylmethanofuran dehydrogenase subunit D